MDWNNSNRVKFWIVVIPAFVLLLYMVGCLSSKPAGATTPPVSTSAKMFSHQGLRIPKTSTSTLFSSIGNKRTGPCYGWGHNWPIEDNVAPHKQQSDPIIGVQWCVNKARTRVTKLILYQCADGGGYYAYDGCTRNHGATGYPSLGLSANWHYHFTLPIVNITDTRTPSVVFSVYANAVVAGTFYYDN